MKWIAKARFLSPPIEPYDLVGIIIQHYPSDLSISIRGRNPKTTHELLTVLTEMEESTSFYCPNNSYESQNFNIHRNQEYNNSSHRNTGRNNNNNHNFIRPFAARNNDNNRNNFHNRINNNPPRDYQQNSYTDRGRYSGPNQNQSRRYNASNNNNTPQHSMPQATVHQLNTSGNDEEAHT